MRGRTLQDAEMPDLIHLLFSDLEEDQLYAIKRFQNWICRPDPLIEIIDEPRIVPRFVVLLNADRNIELQTSAALIVANIAAGTSEETKIVIDAGAIPAFIKLLDSEDSNLQDNAVWALGNIAGDCAEYRDLVLHCGVMDPLLRVLSHDKIIKNAIWMLQNLCRGTYPELPDFEEVSRSLPILSSLIFHTDDDILTNACSAICYLANGSSNHIQRVIDTGVCKRLVELMMHSSQRVSYAALRAVGSIATGDDIQTQVILNFSALPSLLQLLKSNDESVRKQCCWAISNITAGNRRQIQEVLNANTLPCLIQILNTGQDGSRQQAAWALANICSNGSVNQIKFLVNSGCIPPFCNLLTVKDSNTLLVVLESLKNILYLGEIEVKVKGGKNRYATMIEECSGGGKIFALKFHENPDVNAKANQIVETYKFTSN